MDSAALADELAILLTIDGRRPLTLADIRRLDALQEIIGRVISAEIATPDPPDEN